MKHYSFVDYATQGYLILVAGLILLLHGDAVPAWGWLVGAHVLCLGLIHGLIRASAARPANDASPGRGHVAGLAEAGPGSATPATNSVTCHPAISRPSHRLLDFLRHFYPVLLYTGLYAETGALNQMVCRGYLDPVFFQLDERLFGFAPCFRFMELLPYRIVSEVFYFAYFSYYLMIAGVGLALFLRNRTQFFHYVSVTSFVFYVCYLTYIFLPVVGPRIYYADLVDIRLPAAAMPALVPEFPVAVREGVFYRVMEIIYTHFESPGAAFPSSHVALAWVTVYFSFLYLPAIRWPHLILAGLLSLATVYCRYHFAVDVVAGGVTAALLLPLGNWLYRSTRPA